MIRVMLEPLTALITNWTNAAGMIAKRQSLPKQIKMKIIIFISLLFCVMRGSAQVKKVSIQASGLTCSMCSKAIYKALRSVDFVEKVDADIKNSTFEISFKPNTDV